MVMCDENSGGTFSQSFDDGFEMVVVFYRSGVDHEPAVRAVDDIGVRPVIGHLSRIVGNDPLNALGHLDSLSATRFGFREKHAAFRH
jgi:hypothetical protein